MKIKKSKKPKTREPVIFQVPLNEVKNNPVIDKNKKSSLLDPETIEKIDKIYMEIRQKSKNKEPIKPIDLPAEKIRPQSHVEEYKIDRRRASKGLPPKNTVITVKELAYDYQIKAKDLRRMIRKSNIVRPSGRWEWASESKALRKIKRII